MEKLEKRVRRYKRRLKDHHTSRNGASEIPETLAGHYTVRVDDESGESEGNHPVIIAELEKGIGEFAVSEAVMQLDLTEKQFLVFRNAAHGGVNVVYRRGDGHIGWIDPSVGSDGGMNGSEVLEG